MVIPDTPAVGGHGGSLEADRRLLRPPVGRTGQTRQVHGFVARRRLRCHRGAALVWRCLTRRARLRRGGDRHGRRRSSSRVRATDPPRLVRVDRGERLPGVARLLAAGGRRVADGTRWSAADAGRQPWCNGWVRARPRRAGPTPRRGRRTGHPDTTGVLVESAATALDDASPVARPGVGSRSTRREHPRPRTRRASIARAGHLLRRAGRPTRVGRAADVRRVAGGRWHREPPLRRQDRRLLAR